MSANVRQCLGNFDLPPSHKTHNQPLKGTLRLMGARAPALKMQFKPAWPTCSAHILQRHRGAKCAAAKLLDIVLG